MAKSECDNRALSEPNALPGTEIAFQVTKQVVFVSFRIRFRVLTHFMPIRIGVLVHWNVHVSYLMTFPPIIASYLQSVLGALFVFMVDNFKTIQDCSKQWASVVG